MWERLSVEFWRYPIVSFFELRRRWCVLLVVSVNTTEHALILGFKWQSTRNVNAKTETQLLGPKY